MTEIVAKLSPEAPRDHIAQATLDLLAVQNLNKSICSSDVARAVAQVRRRPADPPDLWRRYLPAVRQQALHLARRGEIVILRKGKAVDPQAPIKGVVRLTMPPAKD